MESNKYIACSFLDLQKAYDLVDRNVLFDELAVRLDNDLNALYVIGQLIKPSKIRLASDLNYAFVSNRGVPQGS